MPFFQGATDFEINGGNFYDVKGDQHNHRHDQSVKVDGEGNTLNYSPDFSRRDNRTFNLHSSNTNTLAAHRVDGQNYADGSALPQGYAPPPINNEQYQMHLLALAYANLHLTGPQAQRPGNSNLPQITNRPHDNSNDIRNFLPGEAIRAAASHTLPGLQQPSALPQQQPLPHGAQHRPPVPPPIPYPPFPAWAPTSTAPQRPQGHSLPQRPQGHPPPQRPQGHPPPQRPQGHSPPTGLPSFPQGQVPIPMFAAFSAPSPVFTGQDPDLPGFAAFMAQQQRLSQLAPSPNNSVPTPQPPPTEGAQSLSHGTQDSPPQNAPSAPQSAPGVQPEPNPATKPTSFNGRSYRPSTASSTSSGSSGDSSDDGEDLQDPTPARPTAVVSAATPTANAAIVPTNTLITTSSPPTSPTNAVPIPSPIPTPSSTEHVPWSGLPPNVAPMVPSPLTTPPLSTPTSPPVSTVVPTPLTTPSINAPTSPQISTLPPLSSLLAGVPATALATGEGKKKRQSWLDKLTFKKKSKAGKATPAQ